MRESFGPVLNTPPACSNRTKKGEILVICRGRSSKPEGISLRISQ